MEPFTAVYSMGKIVVPTQSEADSLYQDGYGYREKRVHMLSPVEALYNIERNKVTVIDEDTNQKLSFQELLRLLTPDHPYLWTNFIVFKDLRTRGFIIEIEKQVFKVYKRGTYRKQPPSYIVHIVSKGRPERISDLIDELTRTEKHGYEMKIAVVDRRGELVYYSLNEKEL